MSDILSEIIEFLEDMHIVPPEETIERSIELRKKVQAARAQGGEAVAWLVERPSPWKPKVFLSNSDALRFSDSRHDASKPLPLICPQPADDWIKCSELTLEHADERGEVWGLDDIGNVDLVKAGSLLDGWHSHLVAFRPTGLKRPNPPAKGSE